MSTPRPIPPIFRAPGIGRLTPWMSMPTPTPTPPLLSARGSEDMYVSAGPHNRATPLGWGPAGIWPEHIAHGAIPEANPEEAGVNALGYCNRICEKARQEMLHMYRGDEHRMATLNYLIQHDGRWGDEARRFDRTLTWLEDRIARYDELSRTYRANHNPSLQLEMQQLAVHDIASRVAWIRGSFIHRMFWDHERAITRAQRDILPLFETLAEVDVASHREAVADRQGSMPVDLKMQYRRPEDLSWHISSHFNNVSTAELIDLKVIVSSAAQAVSVRRAIERRGIVITRNMDVIDADDGALVRKELEIILPSEQRLTFDILVDLPAGVRGEHSVISTEPAQHIRIGNGGSEGVELSLSVEADDAFALWRYLMRDGRRVSEILFKDGAVVRRYTNPAFEGLGLDARLISMARLFSA